MNKKLNITVHRFSVWLRILLILTGIVLVQNGIMAKADLCDVSKYQHVIICNGLQNQNTFNWHVCLLKVNIFIMDSLCFLLEKSKNSFEYNLPISNRTEG